MNAYGIVIAELSKLLEVPESRLSSASVLADFDNWDSLAQVSLVGYLQSQEGIVLTSSEIDKPKTVQELVALVENKKKSSEAA